MAKLRHFQPDELLFNDQESIAILNFFFLDSLVPPAVTIKDREFAQALLFEAIDSSYYMGWIEKIWRFGSKPTASLKGIAKELRKIAQDEVRRRISKWFSHATEADLRDAKIFETVRVTLGATYMKYMQERRATGVMPPY